MHCYVVAYMVFLGGFWVFIFSLIVLFLFICVCLIVFFSTC